jgi:hypothetical protein
LAQWFWRRSLKCEKFTDDGRQVMAIVHLDLWSRWTKKPLVLFYVIKILEDVVWVEDGEKLRRYNVYKGLILVATCSYKISIFIEEINTFIGNLLVSFDLYYLINLVTTVSWPPTRDTRNYQLLVICHERSNVTSLNLSLKKKVKTQQKNHKAVLKLWNYR